MAAVPLNPVSAANAPVAHVPIASPEPLAASAVVPPVAVPPATGAARAAPVSSTAPHVAEPASAAVSTVAAPVSATGPHVAEPASAAVSTVAAPVSVAEPANAAVGTVAATVPPVAEPASAAVGTVAAPLSATFPPVAAPLPGAVEEPNVPVPIAAEEHEHSQHALVDPEPADVASDPVEEGAICVICHELLLATDGPNEILQLNCGHRYHLECCSRWAAAAGFRMGEDMPCPLRCHLARQAAPAAFTQEEAADEIIAFEDVESPSFL